MKNLPVAARVHPSGGVSYYYDIASVIEAVFGFRLRLYVHDGRHGFCVLDPDGLILKHACGWPEFGPAIDWEQNLGSKLTGFGVWDKKRARKAAKKAARQAAKPPRIADIQ